MSYVNKYSDDARAHTTPREKHTQARQIVEFARSLMLRDQKPGVEACNECLAQHLMLALRELTDQVGAGDLEYEQRGIASRLEDFVSECGEMSDDLLRAAGGGKRPSRRPVSVSDFLRLMAA
jgi:hypothetical protein